ncbi:MAG: 2'-5' RNA ligase family protein [Acidobacteriota bacterium]|nr:2'-5' RNA ligase family protein [Acidobacteriota bacterium]
MTLALDVAILLPAEARAVAERLNRRFDSTGGRGFRFDASHHPHITLSQHFVPRERLHDVRARVHEIVPWFKPFQVQVIGTRRGRSAQVLVVTPSVDLQRLHERLMATLEPYEISTGDMDAFQGGEETPRPSDLAWVASFREHSSYRHYAPHITVAIGSDPVTVEPFTFTASEVALCRLGRYCTCRDRLASWPL